MPGDRPAQQEELRRTLGGGDSRGSRLRFCEDRVRHAARHFPEELPGCIFCFKGPGKFLPIEAIEGVQSRHKPEAFLVSMLPDYNTNGVSLNFNYVSVGHESPFVFHGKYPDFILIRRCNNTVRPYRETARDRIRSCLWAQSCHDSSM